MIRKWKLLIAGASLAGLTARAQHEPVDLFPGGAPGETAGLTEHADSAGAQTGGRSVLRITGVSRPTLTVYPAPGGAAAAPAVVVCPGGGYDILAYDLEGTEICAWLNRLGITGILLKYRVPRRPGRARHEAPLQDVQRALGYVRAHAAVLRLDARRIGVMGFSAGAHLAAMASTRFGSRTYPPVDEADSASCRPDFCLLVYPAYLDGGHFRLAPELQVTAATPPTLMVQAEDDRAYIDSSLFYYYALKEAGVPAWLHLYSRGGHGYGLRDTGAAVNRWPDRAADWFREIGVTE